MKHIAGFFLLFFAIQAYSAAPATSKSFSDAIRASQQGDYEASEKLFSSLEHSSPTYNFYRAVNNFSLNRKEKALKYIHSVEYSFVPVPQRYMDVALIMRYDMETWKENSDDLGDIAREMKKAEDRLKNNKGGKETQKIQKGIEDRLAKMIKDAEDAAEAAAKAAMEAQAKGLGQGQGTAPTPQTDTLGGTEQGTGEINKKKVREIAELWGKLPEKERAQALRELTRNMPAKDRAIMESYFKELQKRSGK